ncbi:MAG: DUF456 domain-containing protein [Bacteroidota bacterium]
MPPGFEFTAQVLLETLTLFVLLVGLFGLIVPVFPGLTIMWLAALVYALIQNARGLMNGWDWFLFAVLTLLMIAGNIVDNVIIAAKMRDKYIPWSSILLAFAASIVASIFLTPVVGVIAAPVALLVIEYIRLRDRRKAFDSTRTYVIGAGWAFLARFGIGVLMIGVWMLWAWVV